MTIIANTLTTKVETWSDPGDYPSGAGSGPLPSHNYVEGIEGTVQITLEKSDWDRIADFRDGISEENAVGNFINEDPNQIDPEVSGVTVTKWAVEKLAGDLLVLSVDEFDAEAVEPDEPEYDPCEDWDRWHALL